MTLSREWHEALIEKGKRRASFLITNGISLLFGTLSSVEHFDWMTFAISTKISISVAGTLIVLSLPVFLYYFFKARRFKD